MQKFYFTFGTDDKYPFKGGWVVVIALDRKSAIKAFQKEYPNRPGSDCFNAADCYDEEYFEKTSMYLKDNLGYRCHDVILCDDFIGGQNV